MVSDPCISRRRALCALAALMAAPKGYAQASYPSRPIRLMVGYSGGSGADFVARVIANGLSASLKQGVVVENKPGAGGVIAAQEVARAPSDGYTLLLAAMPQMIINFAADPKLPFHPFHDFAPVSQIVSADLVLITNPQKVPAASLKELIAWSQKQPVSFFGTPGPGTVAHFLSSIYGETAKAKVEAVHFKSTGDSVTALLGGSLHALFVTYPVAASLAKAGKVRALAVSSPTRSPLFPDTPTVKEAGFPELEAGSWYGVFAPARTPPDLLNRLSAEVVRAARAPELRGKFEEAGMSVTATPREAFARGMQADLERWTRVVKATGFTRQD